MNISEITKHIQSPKVSVALRILVALLVMIVIFWTGVAVGWRKAEFSYRFSDNYYRSFGGRGFSPMNMMGIPDPDDLIGGHGATGQVISVNLPTVIVSDRNGIEKTILITPDTIVRGGRDDIASTTITDRDVIVVLGVPSGKGQIIAKLVRILPPSAPMIGSTSPIIKK